MLVLTSQHDVPNKTEKLIDHLLLLLDSSSVYSDLNPSQMNGISVSKWDHEMWSIDELSHQISNSVHKKSVPEVEMESD